MVQVHDVVLLLLPVAQLLDDILVVRLLLVDRVFVVHEVLVVCRVFLILLGRLHGFVVE